MEQTQRPEDLIKRYLLGELSAAEQNALEDEYFLDRAKYEQIRRVEDELIDSYTRGTLSPADRERFERSYMTNPQRRRHVKFAKAFTQVLDEKIPARSSVERAADSRGFLSWLSRFNDMLYGRGFVMKLAFIAAVLIIASGGILFVIETSRLHAQLANARQEVETQQLRAQTQAQQIADLETRAKELTEDRARLQEQLQGAGESSTRPAPASVIFPLTLSVIRDSGQESQALIIPRGVEDVGLLMNLTAEQKFPGYQIILLRVDGKEVFSRKGVRPQSTNGHDFVMVSIPARKFATGDNMLSVSGISSAGESETLSKIIIKVQRQ